MMPFNFHREYEADLLKRLKTGDQHAWVEYTRDYGRKVYKYLLTSLPDAESVEDILNETMGAAVKAIQKFDGSTSLTTFTLALANKKVADFWRKRQQTQALDESNLPVVQAVDELVEERLEFFEALNRLPKPEQEALLLRYQVGLSVEEIAKTMKHSYKGIESLLFRSRQHLREAITDVSSRSTSAAAEFQPLLHSVLRTLNEQIQRCLAHGMTKEAAIFTDYLQMLTALANESDLPAQTETQTNRLAPQFPPAYLI